MNFKRRVQLTGASTFTLSLPKEWASRNGVQAGTELFIFEEGDGSLRVRKQGGDGDGGRTADIAMQDYSSESELRRIFLAAYVGGFDAIRLKSEKPISSQQRKAIVSEVDRLIGLEVIEESPEEILVQDFFSQKELSIEKTLKRAYMIASGMQEEAVKALVEGDAELAESVCKRDDEVDRLHFLILRQLNLALNSSSVLQALKIKANDCLYYSEVARCVEGIADSAFGIAENIGGAKINGEGMKQIAKASADVSKIHERSLKSFFSRDLAEANRLIDEAALLRKRIIDLAKKFQLSKEALRLGIALTNIARIVDYGEDIAEITIDRGKA